MKTLNKLMDLVWGGKSNIFILDYNIYKGKSTFLWQVLPPAVFIYRAKACVVYPSLASNSFPSLW